MTTDAGCRRSENVTVRALQLLPLAFRVLPERLDYANDIGFGTLQEPREGLLPLLKPLDLGIGEADLGVYMGEKPSHAVAFVDRLD